MHLKGSFHDMIFFFFLHVAKDRHSTSETGIKPEAGIKLSDLQVT